MSNTVKRVIVRVSVAGVAGDIPEQHSLTIEEFDMAIQHYVKNDGYMGLLGVTLGHPEEPGTAQNDPTFGEVKSLWRDGNDLLAVVNVHASLLKDLKASGCTGISAVWLLGAKDKYQLAEFGWTSSPAIKRCRLLAVLPDV